MPGLARLCPDLPGRASTGSWDPRYTPSRAHVSIRHQAARPPAGVSNPFHTLAGSHNIACKLHAITEDYHPPGRHQNCIFRVLQPFRAKTPIFIKKSYFYQASSQRPQSLDPYFLGSLKPWKSKEIALGATLGHRSRSKSVAEGAPGALERPKGTEGRAQAAQGPIWTALGRF